MKRICAGIVLAFCVEMHAAEKVAWTVRVPAGGSLAAAQADVRKALARKDLQAGVIEVVVADGKYRLAEPLRFGKEDSGSAVNPVRWRAATRGGVRLTGGVPLPRLKKLGDDAARATIPVEAHGKVGVVDLKAAGITDYGVVAANGVGGPGEGMQLVWDGRLQTLARWPNEGFTGIAKTPPVEKDPQTGRPRAEKSFFCKEDRPLAWTKEAEPYGNGFFKYNWAAARVAFEKIDPVTREFTQKGRGSHYGYSVQGFWFGYNLLCELDRPGEYYIDRAAGKLYYWPTTSRFDPEAELTVTRDLLVATDLSWTTFDGFVFENCRNRAFQARGGERLDLVGCTFRNIGAKAIDYTKTVRSRIAGCDIAYCVSGGVNVYTGDQRTLTHGDVVVENCHIHHYALGELTYAAAVGFGGCGVTVRNCTIHDGPHTALLFGGREHLIEANEIHSVCLHAGEMGAVYCGRNWTLCGNVIRGNYFHDIYNPRNQRNRAIMLDDGCAGITVVSNRMVRVAEGVSLSAIGNVVENNLFVSNFPPVSAWQKWQNAGDYTNPGYTHRQLLDTLAELPVHEEPWRTKYPYLGMIDEAIKTGRMRDPATRTSIQRNVSYGGSTNLVAWMGAKYAYSPETWLVGDNIECGREKPAGFAPLPPLGSIGVQRTPERATWPVEHPVTITCGNLVFKK